MSLPPLNINNVLKGTEMIDFKTLHDFWLKPTVPRGMPSLAEIKLIATTMVY